MARDADIVVVGAGVVGAATARALAGSVGTVILLEQFALGHAHGSSHGTSRIFRLNYPDERYVRMAQAAGEAWRELERERDVQLLVRSGSLDLGPVAAETARALSACGVRYETLSAEDVRSRWPLRLDEGETAVFQADGGIVLADRAHRALLESASDDGVELRENAPVRSLALERRGVRVTLDSDEISARSVVVTAGSWSPRLLADVEIELPVVPTRETVIHLGLDGAEPAPSVIDYARIPGAEDGVTRAGQAAYALASPGVGLKAGLHHSGPVADPDDDPAPDERVARWVAKWAGERFEGLGDLAGIETCLYTSTADEGFVLERQGRIVVGAACSGHGFKFAPVVGRTLAALAREAAS
jgi:sarcosine oxidase